MKSRRYADTLALAIVAMLLASGTTAGAAGLVLDRSIPLKDVAGRIDHLAIDLKANTLFVAEHDNGTLDAIDLAAGKPAGRVGGLSDPQGVAYDGKTNRVIVASGGDGTVRFYDADALAPMGKVELGGDADNVRINPTSGQVLVGYGDGGLAEIDIPSGTVVAKIDIGGHPESFQIEAQGSQAYVNVPDRGQVAIVDLKSAKASGIDTPGLGGNFPMAIEPTTGRLLVGFRSPGAVALIDPGEGTIITSLKACGDADDLFFDAKRSVLYVVCGVGAVDVIQVQGDRLTAVAEVPSSAGARTGLYVPELDRLFVAAPARKGKDAQIIVLKPQD